MVYKTLPKLRPLCACRRWAMVRQAWTASRAYQLAWGLRDLLALKHSQAAVHGVSKEEGMLLWQNAASKAMFGGYIPGEWFGPGQSVASVPFL